jgi:hypothetical protein
MRTIVNALRISIVAIRWEYKKAASFPVLLPAAVAEVLFMNAGYLRFIKHELSGNGGGGQSIHS